MGPSGPQTASKAVNMHETIVRACLVDHMHVMGPGGASPHPAQRHGMSSTCTLHVKGNHHASPQSRPTHQAATGPASSHPQLCPVWMARPPHTPRRAHALLAHDALPAPLSHLDHLAAMHAAVLMSAGGMRQLSFSIIGQLRGTPKTATAAPWANASLLLS